MPKFSNQLKNAAKNPIHFHIWTAYFSEWYGTVVQLFALEMKRNALLSVVSMFSFHRENTRHHHYTVFFSDNECA